MGRTRRPGVRTYRQSGVDLGARATAVSALLRAARYRAPSSHGRVLAAPGHFAGLVRLGKETVAITTDTVGTKVLLAEQLDRWEEVGEDLVAVNVNDLAAVGARPVGLVDTILYGSSSVRTFRAIGRGVRRGLSKARCSLLGGETAQVAEIVRGIDLGGTALGFYPRGRTPVLGSGIRAGDVVLGVPSSGFHANGYTLLRRIISEHRADLRAVRKGAPVPLGQELLRATRIYTPVSEALSGLPGIHGFAHLSGGGVRNLLRLNSEVRYVLDGFPSPPPLFSWLARLGGLEPEELYQTFNMGVGFAVVAAARTVEPALRTLAAGGVTDAFLLGHVERGHGVDVPGVGVRYDGYA